MASLKNSELQIVVEITNCSYGVILQKRIEIKPYELDSYAEQRSLRVHEACLHGAMSKDDS